ncbi:glycosyltransferase [Microaceticoccus formicicus]|uniref:glycosyltransferase n=1 Tax=Microaceticoccus formicicus TaxID=3118105 RepID=UPI003CD03070|nr:glycosyltransferase [Peptoniphilaceae bacterium AMB_02]
MLDLLYLSFVGIDDKNYKGVNNKILGQLDALESLSYSTKLLTFNKNGLIIYEKESQKLIKPYRIKRMLKNYRRIGFVKEIVSEIVSQNPRILYIRYNLSEPFFISILKSVRSKINGIIVVEIPSYPYELELNPIKRKIDSIFSKNLNKYVDYLALTTKKYDSIFGVNAIYIGNGISMNKSFEVNNKKTNKLILSGVALISNWHGYDRIIRGLRSYYDSNNSVEIEVRIIGLGPEYHNLIRLVERMNLTNHVKFLGICEGDKLLDEYAKMNMGIGALGIYRKGLDEAVTLKIREYCAFGLPFIYAGNDPDITGKFEYALQFPNDNSDIDINKIVEFYDKISSSTPDYKEKIKEFAYENLSWESKMKDFLLKLDSYRDKIIEDKER